MSSQNISALLALSLISSPIALPAATPSLSSKTHASIAPSETTSQRAAARKMRYELAATPVLQPMGTQVGELHEKWKFPSDHLPIGMTFEDLHFVSWNVLDTACMKWVIENSQGLSRSQIVDENVYIGDSKLTVRERHVVDLILETINHPTHPRSILTLQECGEQFLAEMRSRLPSHFAIVSHNGDAIVLDKRRFEILEVKEVAGVFSASPHRTFQEIKIRRCDNGQEMKLINIHMPGDPTKPGRFEFAQYLQRTFDPSITTLAMGDMNFNELEMAQAFGSYNPFSIYSPYPTNISPYVFNSKAIDHFFVYSTKNSPVDLSSPDQIMSSLAPILDLLNGRG